MITFEQNPMNKYQNLIICSSNKGKIKEFNSIFNEESDLKFRTISEIYNENFDPEENGLSFSENAYIKAKAGFDITSKLLDNSFLVIADDSGIEISALDGRPGIYSGRYLKQLGGGIQGVLAEMQNQKNRECRFVCNITALDYSGKKVFETEQYWYGVISDNPRGTNGFGYDPIVIPRGFQETVAELDKNTKDKISHRAQALKKLLDFLRN
jgi:XTP/dITP diphosphohydrolase